MFYDRVKISDLGNRCHVLKQLHGRMIFGPFEGCFHEDSLWRGHKAVIFFILKKQICVHLFPWGSV